MTIQLPRIAMLGAGSMGSAILGGLVHQGVETRGITVTNRTAEKADALRIFDVESLSLQREPDANRVAVAEAGLVIVAVKPAMVRGVLDDIRGHVPAAAVIVSVAAGVTTASMEAALPNRMLRAMPNTPASLRLGVTGVAAGSRATEADTRLVTSLFSAVGDVVVVPEEQLDALSTISGSGPAYVYLLIEEFEKTARGMGFSGEQARTLVRGTFRGAVELLHDAGEPPAELRRRVTSPHGTTERAIEVLQGARLDELFGRATAAALARARELAAEG